MVVAVLSNKRKLWDIVEICPEGNTAASICQWSVTALILVNIFAVVIETVETVKAQFGYFLTLFELFSLFIFTVEYATRVYSCTVDLRYSSPIKGRLLFIVTPLSIIDLLAIVPSLTMYVAMALHFKYINTSFLRALRLMRLFRMFKLTRYSEAIQSFIYVIRRKQEELTVTMIVMMILLLFSSCIVYFLESAVQPDVFTSIPISMWWGVATLTSVGYGDIYPVTPFGRLFGAIIALLGLGLFALPTGILASGFAEELNRRKDIKPGPCTLCGHMDANAHFNPLDYDEEQEGQVGLVDVSNTNEETSANCTTSESENVLVRNTETV